MFHRAFTGFARFQKFIIRLTVSQQGNAKDIGRRFRLIPCWRLQHRTGRVVKSHNWSSSAPAECSSSGSQRNSQVRPRLDTSAHLLLSTFRIAASLRLMLPVVSGSALQVAISSSCHDTVAPSLVVGRFLLQARQPGTRCQTISVIRHSAKTLLGDLYRHTSLLCIRACSVLEALRKALQYINVLLTYLLTYLQLKCRIFFIFTKTW